MKYILILIGLSMLLMGCPQQDANPSTGAVVLDDPLMNTIDEPLIVENGDRIKVEYTGRYVDGNVFDTSIGKLPLQFSVGIDSMIAGFEKAVIGMKINEEKLNVVMPPEDAYGTLEDNPPTIEVIDLNLLVGEGLTLEIGDILPHPTLPYDGEVLEIDDQNAVTLEITHRFAGKTLIFDIKVVEILKQGIMNTP